MWPNFGEPACSPRFDLNASGKDLFACLVPLVIGYPVALRCVGLPRHGQHGRSFEPSHNQFWLRSDKFPCGEISGGRTRFVHKLKMEGAIPTLANNFGPPLGSAQRSPVAAPTPSTLPSSRAPLGWPTSFSSQTPRIYALEGLMPGSPAQKKQVGRTRPPGAQRRHSMPRAGSGLERPTRARHRLRSDSICRAHQEDGRSYRGFR